MKTDRWMMFGTKLAVLGAALLLSSVARADDYVVVKGSNVEFLAKITASSFVAKSEDVSGKVTHDGASSAITGGELRVGAGSFKTGMSMRDTHMREKYLEAEKFPQIKLMLDGSPIAAKAGTKATITGRFVIKGKQRAVKIPVQISQGKDGALVAEGKFKLDITQYGIAQPSFAVVKMEPVVDVTVHLVLKPSK